VPITMVQMPSLGRMFDRSREINAVDFLTQTCLQRQPSFQSPKPVPAETPRRMKMATVQSESARPINRRAPHVKPGRLSVNRDLNRLQSDPQTLWRRRAAQPIGSIRRCRHVREALVMLVQHRTFNRRVFGFGLPFCFRAIESVRRAPTTYEQDLRTCPTDRCSQFTSRVSA